MHDTDTRPLLAEARRAADDYLLHKVVDNGMALDVSQRLATTGFTTAVRILSALRTQNGLSEDTITDRFEWQLKAAHTAGDAQRVIAAEYTLAIWDGMRRDLAAYLARVGE
jgi:hypothetical protein